MSVEPGDRAGLVNANHPEAGEQAAMSVAPFAILANARRAATSEPEGQVKASHYTHLIEYPGEAQALDEDGDVTQSQPQRLGPRLAIALACKEAAELRDQARHGVQRRDRLEQFLLVQQERCLPFLSLEQQVGRQLGQAASQPHQPIDAPGHQHVRRQRHLDAFDMA